MAPETRSNQKSNPGPRGPGPPPVRMQNPTSDPYRPASDPYSSQQKPTHGYDPYAASQSHPSPSDVKGLSDLYNQFKQVNELLYSLGSDIKTIREENVSLKQSVLHQASLIANLEQEIDELAQYGRRGNVIFTNLNVDTSDPAQSAANTVSKVIDLCHEIGVEVVPSDLVAAHPLKQGKRSAGKPKRFVARFHDRSKAQEVFRRRKGCKDIAGSKKELLAANKSKGFGLLPHLTAKRAKLFEQSKSFCVDNKFQGVWADTNNGNILLKLREHERGIVIKSTADLLQIQDFQPNEYIFCAPPIDFGYRYYEDNSIPVANKYNSLAKYQPY